MMLWASLPDLNQMMSDDDDDNFNYLSKYWLRLGYMFLLHHLNMTQWTAIKCITEVR